MENDTMILQSCDGEQFTVLSCLASQSQTISDLRKDAADGDPIPLVNISSKTLRRVVEYMMHAKDKDHKPAVEEEDPALVLDDPNRVLDKPYELTEFEKDFIKDLDYQDLEDLMTAANYLDMKKTLMAVAMRGIAMLFLGKTADDLYKIYDVTEPITAEEEAAVLAENPWLADK